MHNLQHPLSSRKVFFWHSLHLLVFTLNLSREVLYFFLRSNHQLDETSQSQAYLIWIKSTYASSHKASQLLVVNSCICTSHITTKLLDVKYLAYASSHIASHILDVKSCIGLSHRVSQLLDVRSLAYAFSHRSNHLLDVKFLHMTFSSGSHCPIGTTFFSCWMWDPESEPFFMLAVDHLVHLQRITPSYEGLHQASL